MPMNIKTVREFVRRSGLFGLSAQTVGDMALRCCKSESPELYLLVSLTVQALEEQHICCQMTKFAGTVLTSRDNTMSLQLPSCREWCKVLEREEFKSVVKVMHDRHEEAAVPEVLLIIDRQYGCYLQRQWCYEQSIAAGLLMRAGNILELPELPEKFLHGLVSYFPDAEKHPATDCQQLAVMSALRRRLLVLTGGPGTGKTTVAAAILALKLWQNNSLRIMLAAPTAKAAQRLMESLKDNLSALNCSQEVKEVISGLQATTIHQLLGFRYGSNEFKYNTQNPLPCDLLLVDECSMVPQRLMAQLIEALNLDSTLILLGDRYQLASVEAGSVLADICDSAAVNRADSEFAGAFFRQTSWQIPEITEAEKLQHPLAGAIVELTENHRFAVSAPLLGRVAALIRNIDEKSNIPQIAAELASFRGDEYEFLTGDSTFLRRLLQKKLSAPRLASGESFCDLPKLAASGLSEDRKKAFALLNTFKVLSPAYNGATGIHEINKMCMEILGLNDQYQPGAVLMIRQNDYRQELYNGDIGIVWSCDGETFVVFENHPGGFELNELPDHELVFAMSVHKSQGSGFDEVLFVMPPTAGELMNREMVYTAMTRAKKHLCTIGTPEVLADALARRTSRMSNLTGRLICDWSESLF